MTTGVTSILDIFAFLIRDNCLFSKSAYFGLLLCYVMLVHLSDHVTLKNTSEQGFTDWQVKSHRHINNSQKLACLKIDWEEHLE